MPGNQGVPVCAQTIESRAAAAVGPCSSGSRRADRDRESGSSCSCGWWRVEDE